MLNLRKIDSKFWLSGGWVDIPEDAKWLRLNGFKAVLDLQFTQQDYNPKSAGYIRDCLLEENIEYLAVPMNDGENVQLEKIFEIAYNQISDWDQKYQGRFDKILIKCGVGVSRSVAILINYYCIRDRLTYSEARYRIAAADQYNYGGLPIGIDIILDLFLKTAFPDISSAFGEKEV